MMWTGGGGRGETEQRWSLRQKNARLLYTDETADWRGKWECRQAIGCA